MFEVISLGKRELRCLRKGREKIEIMSKSVDCIKYSRLFIDVKRIREEGEKKRVKTKWVLVACLLRSDFTLLANSAASTEISYARKGYTESEGRWVGTLHKTQ